MQVTQCQSESQVITETVQSTVADYFAIFRISTLLNRCGIRKIRGARPLAIITELFCLPFQGVNLYWGLVHTRKEEFGKNAIYDVLRRPNYNWRSLLLNLSALLIRFFTSLSDDRRETVLIIDDSIIERSRSKKVELLARVFDHCSQKYLRGFRLLALTWSDGTSSAPVDFSLLSSAKAENRYQGITTDVDKRSCGYLRRMEAMKKTTELLEPMVKRALRAGINARHLLMDSWFGFPAIITKLSKHLPVICMVKRMKTVFYTYQGKKMALTTLYRKVKKRPGKARILASVLVTIAPGQVVKIVFVRDHRKKDWLALLSTDIELADEEIVRIYGKRWDIEVFFKMCKQYLHLVKGVQMRNFDGLIAQTTIALMRYLFLSYRQRCDTDDRTIGELFRATCDEARDISLIDALQRILNMIADALRQIDHTSQQFIKKLVDNIMGTILTKMNLTPLCEPYLIAT